MYYIYCITNNINGKTYIGQHKTIHINDSYMGSGVYLKRSKEKYGLENFSKKILAIAETKKNVDILEKVFIALYRACGKAEYNITDGGDGICCSGQFEIERRLKISKASVEHWKNYSDDKKENLIKKIALGNKGKKHPHSEETKNKISKASIEHWKRKGYKEFVGKKISESLKGRKRNKPVWNKGKSTGLHWWTNGVENVCSFECPKGFYKGRTLSDEQLLLLKTQNIGRTHVVTEETRKKISEMQKKNPNRAMLGKKHSDESKIKISKAHKGKILSNDTKEKIKNFMLGKKMSIINNKRTWV